MHQSSKIIVLGGRSAGKTALVLRCLTGHFFSQPSTTTDTAYHYEYNGNQMDIIDSKGKNEALISFADGIILVYSVTDRASFYYLQTIMNKVRRLNFNQDLKITVVGTKNDRTKHREVSLYEGQEFAVDNGSYFVETSSCIPKRNIQEIFIQVMSSSAKLNNDHRQQIRVTSTKRQRKCSHDFDSSPPPSPTRKISSHKIYDSVRNFVQKKRRQSTSDYYSRQQHLYQHHEEKALNRELSKSLAMF